MRTNCARSARLDGIPTAWTAATSSTVQAPSSCFKQPIAQESTSSADPHGTRHIAHSRFVVSIAVTAAMGLAAAWTSSSSAIEHCGSTCRSVRSLNDATCRLPSWRVVERESWPCPSTLSCLRNAASSLSSLDRSTSHAKRSVCHAARHTSPQVQSAATSLTDAVRAQAAIELTIARMMPRRIR